MHTAFRYTGWAELRDHRRHLSEHLRDVLDHRGPLVAAAGIDAAAKTGFLRNAPVSVLRAAFDQGRAVGELTDGAFEAVGEHRGYRLLEGEGREFGLTAVGVADDTLVWAQGPVQEEEPPDVSHVTDLVETAVDVGTGNGTRYVDVSSDLVLLLDAVGVDAVLWGRTTPEVTENRFDLDLIEGEVAWGANLTVNGPESLSREAFVFADESDVDRKLVRNWLTRSGMTFGDEVDDPDISRDGRVVTVEGTIRTDEF
jgi:hypothetical protein